MHYQQLTRLDLNPLIFMIEETQKNNPLHGKTLKEIVVFLEQHYGWEKLGTLVRINCFIDNPGVESSLKFLRKTDWARKKVEDLYIATVNQQK